MSESNQQTLVNNAKIILDTTRIFWSSEASNDCECDISYCVDTGMECRECNIAPVSIATQGSIF